MKLLGRRREGGDRWQQRGGERGSGQCKEKKREEESSNWRRRKRGLSGSKEAWWGREGVMTEEKGWRWEAKERELPWKEEPVRSTKCTKAARQRKKPLFAIQGEDVVFCYSRGRHCCRLGFPNEETGFSAGRGRNWLWVVYRGRGELGFH